MHLAFFDTTAYFYSEIIDAIAPIIKVFHIKNNTNLG